MKEDCISHTLKKNLSSIKDIQEKLQNIKDIKLHSIYSTLESNNLIKKDETITSTLCIKIKDKNIRKVPFGICLDIGSDVFDEYLYAKKICTINLYFHLKNLSNEHNNAYFVHNLDHKSELTSFVTKDNQLNIINLTENINLLEEKIRQNNKISFFIPMFESYDNYDEFYEAIHNVKLKINYLE